jgi:hypothetical protein
MRCAHVSRNHLYWKILLAAALVLSLPLQAAAAGQRATVATGPSVAIPSDTELFADEFSDLSGWSVVTGGQGTVAIAATGGQDGGPAARITVPNYTTESIAYLKHTLAEPVNGLSAVGWFKVTTGGCDGSAGYSAGNVPFFRFFDANSNRIVGLYRINGSCSKTAKLYVQHSGNFYRTGKNIGFGGWYKLELRAAVGTPGSSLVQVYVNDSLAYESNTANNGIQPFNSVNIGNEHKNQVGDFYADKVRLGSFGAAPPSNPCDSAAPAPTTSDPGTVVLADNFESFDFSKWTTVGLSGDGIASIQTAQVHSNNCAAKLHVTSSSSSKANLSKTLPAGTAEVYADGWFNVIADGATSSNVPMFRLFNGSSRLVDVYRVNGSGALYARLPNGSGGFTYTSLGRTRALGTWFHLNVHVVAANSTSTVQVTVDGTSVLNRTDVALGTSSLTSVQIGSELLAQQGDLIVDDVVLKKVP